MIHAPFSNHTIKVKSELFGREGLLKKLVNAVDIYHYNVNIVGCRRFGKTCVLEVLNSVIRESPDSRSYPIYIDAKSWNIGQNSNGKIGTANVYKYLLAILLESLTKDGVLKEEVKDRDCAYVPIKNRHLFYQSLGRDCDSSIADSFADAVRFFSCKMGKTIAFLFDEYEFLMTKAFGESTGFQTLRKLSAEDIDGFRPCSFLVAGAVTWEHLCSSIGSKELNTIGAHIHYVKPLKRDAFEQYWQAECEKIDEEDLRKRMLDKCDFVYRQSGGVVFHANDIGGCMLVNDGEYPDNYRAVLEEVFESLNFRQKETLLSVAIAPDTVQGGGDLVYLRSMGLVSPDALAVTIKLLNDWILSDSRYNPRERGSYLEVVADEINDLIATINNTIYNKGYTYMFTPQNEDAELIKYTRKASADKASFGKFIDAVWKTHYEKTKDEISGRNKENLPAAFKRTQFTDIVGTLRHTYSGHLYGPKFIMPEGRLTKEDALYALVGSKNEPFGEQEFLTLQKAVLDMYKTELMGILDEVKTWEDAEE